MQVTLEGPCPLYHFLLKGGLGRIDSYLDMLRRLTSLLKMLQHGPCQWDACSSPAPQNGDQTRMVTQQGSAVWAWTPGARQG